MKKIYFMAGFPRSGSTLLSSLLNQNPKIYSSHNTHLQQSVKTFVQNTQYFESVKTGSMVGIEKEVTSGIAQSFYKNVDKSVVIDKNREWCTPYSIYLAKLITDNVKIIFPVRPILEILASFVKIVEKNETNYIDQNMIDSDFWAYYFRPINDARCDWLMKANSQIDAALFGYSLSQKKEYKDVFHLVYYKDLCENPQNELNKIYDFLGEKPFQHQFENIENKEPLDDMAAFGIPTLHYVRSKINVVSVNPKDVLSKYVIQKYGNALESLKSL